MIVDGYEKVDDFYCVKQEHDEMMINKKYITYINYSKAKGSYKICYHVPTITKGVIKEIQGKFVTLTIHNEKSNLYYHNIIPISAIKGIKLISDSSEVFVE